MATYHVAPKGTVTGANNGGSGNDAWNGLKRLNTVIGGSTVAGDTIIFDGDKGPFGFADNADFAYQGALTGAFVYNSGVSGPLIGSTSIAGSTAAGRTFQFQSSTGQAIVDMHRSDANHASTERIYASIMFKGEGMTILNPKVIAPNFNYLKAVDGPAANGQAEGISAENYGLVVQGNGNTVLGVNASGYADTQGFSRACFSLNLQNSGTQGLTTRLGNFTLRGAHFGMDISHPGSNARQTGNVYIDGIDSRDCSWGSTAETGFMPGNAGTHGGHISLSGNYNLAIVSRLYGRGICQDGIDLIAINSKITNSDIRGMYSSGVWWWAWDVPTSKWVLTYRVGYTGNGIKMGYVMTGTSPTTWRGIDGTPGGIYNVDEVRSSAIGNVVEDCLIGIFSNTGNGQFIHANEVYSAHQAGIGLNSFPQRANYWVSNNYAQLAPDCISGNGALLVSTNGSIVMLNNILDSTLAPSCYDVQWATLLSPILKDKNLLVTGRVRQDQVYPTTGDIASFNPGWVKDVGLPAGSPLIRAGLHNGYRADRRGRQFWNPPSVGPFEYQLARPSRFT